MPQIEPNGMLHMAGFFLSVPMQVNFELLFAPVDRQWKVFGISVALAKGSPEAPATDRNRQSRSPHKHLTRRRQKSIRKDRLINPNEQAMLGRRLLRQAGFLYTGIRLPWPRCTGRPIHYAMKFTVSPKVLRPATASPR
ncbi:hypothetical protein [Mesorhizobium sp.]|uniref:hypothetical protein n=1 Tax=Mesorhizobium sp. TaxID=1871066 RepID=UPI00338DAC08